MAVAFSCAAQGGWDQDLVAALVVAFAYAEWWREGKDVTAALAAAFVVARWGDKDLAPVFSAAFVGAAVALGVGDDLAAALAMAFVYPMWGQRRGGCCSSGDFRRWGRVGNNDGGSEGQRLGE